MTTPFIPDNAPFTPAQRAWLNGFLAGIYCRTEAAPAVAAPAKPKVEILFGSQSGNAESLAKRIGKEARKRGYETSIVPLEKVTPATLAQTQCALIITSTWGEGDPPDNAAPLWEKLSSTDELKLSDLRYSVLALGDTNYEHFCGFGIRMDARLAELGAKRLHDRIDCDVNFDEPAAKWQDGVFAALQNLGSASVPLAGDGVPPSRTSETATAETGYSRKNPFPARLLVNRKLTAEGSEKDTRHYEICLKDSGLTYEVGDALGMIPTNCPELVQEILTALIFDGEEEVINEDGANIPIRLALLRDYHIRAPHKDFLAAFASDSSHEIIDILLGSPGIKFAPQEFVGLLKKLQPRLYSIASSLKAFPEQVHLTVDSVHYEIDGRKRKGVCSNFLAERCAEDTPVPVFIQVTKHFRLPENGDVPIIMVGPGTGIAPFRAFLHERRATGAKGGNWLFFGAQKSATDFFYREELETMQRDGVLSRLDLAFSRDQEHKIYVQNRMLENAAELWKWLEAGAHFYVCGDASRMAKDVDAALHSIIETAGGLSKESAEAYVQKLKTGKRYQRDVY